MFRIKWSKKASKQASKIGDHATRLAIEEAVEGLSDFPNTRNTQALTNHRHGYRLRVGRFRVLFDADTVIQIIDIQEVKKRDDRTY